MEEYNLSNAIDSIKYGFSKYDFLLSDDNIGKNGENLSIVILSCNRSLSTIKLLDSIKNNMNNFAGKIVIADNCSTKSELNNLKKYLKSFKFDVNLICFDKNYGVAGGRNKIINYVTTDWIFNLDNDIYFIDNPLSCIQDTISLLGVKFLNIPLLSEDKKTIFSNGGSLFVNYNENCATIGGGSMFVQSQINKDCQLKPSLSTFLLGGASVLNKNAFIECGMFDDNMFVGFEDIDFSITIFEKGLKIGNCPTLSLVHNHTISVDANSLEYEKTRFSKGILKKSAEYFEKKRNFKIWDANVEIWIENRQKELGIKSIDNNLNEVEKLEHKPKIALVVDVEGWCFWNIAKIIKSNLKKYYDIEIIPLELLNNNIIRLLFYTKKFDLTHFFWRGHLSFIESSQDYIKLCGLDYAGFKNLYIDNSIITTSVYDHLYLDNICFTNNIFQFCKNYTVSSNKLFNIYNNQNEIIKKPQMVITDGVDLQLFRPKNLERFKKNDKLVVGWVGNSAWSSEIEDFKGFNTILKPVLNELIAEGYPIDCVFADRQERMIPHDEMPDYYSKIHLCICVSKVEGTPNPVLESMACGVPIITTDVGIVQEALGKKQHEFIMKERTKEELKRLIIKMLDNRSILMELSNENIKQIKKWDWSRIVMHFKEFFDSNLGSEKNEKNK